MLADLASDVGLAEGEETAASERGGAAADSSAQAQERTAVKVEGFAGQVGVLTFLSPQMADVSVRIIGSEAALHSMTEIVLRCQVCLPGRWRIPAAGCVRRQMRSATAFGWKVWDLY